MRKSNPPALVLLESASRHPVIGRKSYLGLNGRIFWQCKDAASRSACAELQSAVNAWLASRPKGLLFMIFAYEWKNALEYLPQKAANDLGFPAATLIACEDVRVREHGLLPPVSLDPPAIHREPLRFPQDWKASMSREEFLRKASEIQRFIAAGDIYQANLSLRFQKKFRGDGWQLYRRLKSVNPSPFGGYLRFGDWEIISCSPERLIRKEGDSLSTRPIAGTKPRGDTKEQDKLRRGELLLSPKEKAEHIMLLDLERNDLGKVCRKGSVHPDETMAVERYSHVQHIVSNVSGRLRPGASFTDILRAVFPGGTITGVPKIRCMQILDGLEPHARGPYTGSFGVMEASGDFDLNIAIRTLWRRGEDLYLQAGAGIVADSLPQAEYEETLQKAKAMALAAEMSSDKIRHSKNLLS